MNYDKLVDLIVHEIYEKMNALNNPVTQFKKSVIVTSSFNKSDITKELEENFKVLFYEAGYREADILVIPYLSIKSMANLANLSVSEELEEFIIKMLMIGKEVYILEEGLEYRRYKNTAPKALYSKYLDFEKQLKIYGIQVISYIGEIKNLDKNLLKLEEKNISEENIFISDESNKSIVEIRNKKVISESEIKKAFLNGINSLVIDKKSIITPLAADFIKTHNLIVKRG